jgi:PAS domain-containing protein
VSRRVAVCQASPARGADGELIAVVATLTEISEQVEIEEERGRLRDRVADDAELLRAMIEQVPSGLLLVDPSGTVRMANDAARALLARPLSVDEPLDATQCGGKENCHDDRRCMTHDLWATLNEKMYEYLSSVTLADLVAHTNGKPVAVIKDFREKEKVAA